MIIPGTDDATLIELLALRQRIAECRRQGLWLTVQTLRHEAMSLAERFVDPAWFDEAAEQRDADRICEATRQAARACAAERVDYAPF